MQLCKNLSKDLKVPGTTRQQSLAESLEAYETFDNFHIKLPLWSPVLLFEKSSVHYVFILSYVQLVTRQYESTQL